MPSSPTIGGSEPRRDGVKLATGRAAFTDDVSMRGLLHAFILRSPHPHARIRRIQAKAAREIPGVAAVLTHEDLRPAATNDASAAEGTAREGLLGDHVQYVGEPVALVAAEDLDLARYAAGVIETDYERLPPILEPSVGGAEGGAVVAELDGQIGDVDRALAEADRVLVRTYRVPRIAQSALEPQVVLAWLDEDQRLAVRTSSHVPFHVRQVLSRQLGLPARRIRVITPRDGGGFGARLGVTLEPLCAALALKTGRPVRLAHSREEEIVSARSGHAQTITLRSAVKGGELVALTMDVTATAGAVRQTRAQDEETASEDWAGATLWGAAGVLALYRCPNVRFSGRSLFANLPPAGALRGDGVSQASFALESHIDATAEDVGEDPLLFRNRHMVREHDPLPFLAALRHPSGDPAPVLASCGLEEAVHRAGRAIGWKWPLPPAPLGGGPCRRGLGMALAMQPPGPPAPELTSATIDMLEDGSFHLFVGMTDIGAGTETVLCQIAAAVLGAPLDAVAVHPVDTDVVPFAAGATRSSALVVSGLAVREAAELVRERLLAHAARSLGVGSDRITLRDGAAYVDDKRRLGYDEIGRETLLGSGPDPIKVTASQAAQETPAPPFAAVFAEVEVDIETGVVRVLKIVEAVDCGRVLNPQIAEARVLGGALQGLGGALSEALTFDAEGRPRSRCLRDYRQVTAVDMPDVTALFVPTDSPDGPFGAKSIAEVAIHGVAPAVANAVAHAIGARITELPLTPERVLTAIGSVRA